MDVNFVPDVSSIIILVLKIVCFFFYNDSFSNDCRSPTDFIELIASWDWTLSVLMFSRVAITVYRDIIIIANTVAYQLRRTSKIFWIIFLWRFEIQYFVVNLDYH